MAKGSQDRDAMGIARGAVGTIDGKGAVAVETLGFRPKYILLVNTVDGGRIEKIDGMTDAQTLQKGAMDTSSAIVIDNMGFTLTAAVAADGAKLVYFVA